MSILVNRKNIIKWVFNEIGWMSKRFCETQNYLVKREYNACVEDFKKYFNLEGIEEIPLDREIIDTSKSKNSIMSMENYCLLQIDKDTSIIIDHQDVPTVKNIRWCIDHNGYPSGTISKKERINLHNLLLNFSPVDHLNRNKLDNRRRNLRKTTNSLNNKNTSTKGYSWSTSRNKWIVTIKANKKNIFIGRYLDERDAKIALFNARMDYFGEYSPDFHIIKSLRFIQRAARKYAHGRQSYAVSMYNEAILEAQRIGVIFEPDPIDGIIEAKDGMFDKEWFEARKNNSVKFITEE